MYLSRNQKGVEALYGLKGISAAARSSHGDAMEIGKGVEIEHEVSIWFWIPEFLKSRKAKIRLVILGFSLAGLWAIF